jgi:hypothetical protein
MIKSINTEYDILDFLKNINNANNIKDANDIISEISIKDRNYMIKIIDNKINLIATSKTPSKLDEDIAFYAIEIFLKYKEIILNLKE